MALDQRLASRAYSAISPLMGWAGDRTRICGGSGRHGHLHYVLSKLNRTKSRTPCGCMRLLWMRIKPQDANFDLAREIARRFRILEQPPEHDLDLYRCGTGLVGRSSLSLRLGSFAFVSDLPVSAAPTLANRARHERGAGIAAPPHACVGQCLSLNHVRYSDILPRCAAEAWRLQVEASSLFSAAPQRSSTQSLGL